MNLNLMKYKTIYFLISVIFLVPSIFSLLVWGLKPAIDFTGGSVLEIKSAQDTLKVLQSNSSKVEELGIELLSIQESGEGTFILKMKEIDKDKKQELLEAFRPKADHPLDEKKEFGEIEEVRFETLGPAIGRELIKKTVLAIILAAGFILVYVAYRFQDKKYGVCAILAMFHDTIILLGAFSLLGHFLGVEVDTLFVTAVLTILSFSVHDTVVVYDRIRDSVRRYPQVEFSKLVNKAVVETLTRSINNSMTIIFMLLCLYLFGGQTIRWFTFALLLGTIYGTYSSTFTAAPLLIVWENFKKKKK
ncbi:MAG TPA: protein translocase subunit SecF [Candidatus Bathyarchaeia archaeon]|nr:protein translocase subunit SecF [Candidatus Bathyarchaeia archaeon]